MHPQTHEKCGSCDDRGKQTFGLAAWQSFPFSLRRTFQLRVLAGASSCRAKMDHSLPAKGRLYLQTRDRYLLDSVEAQADGREAWGSASGSTFPENLAS